MFKVERLVTAVMLVTIISLVPMDRAHSGGQTSRYTIVDTGQQRCYGAGREIGFPEAGRRFFGQDAQYEGNQPAYRDNGDGTVSDLNTGLMWQKTPDFVTRRSWEEAVKYARSLRIGGYSDWRLPTIKELFSIADFRGSIHTSTPYIDTRWFDFQYPDRSTGLRDIDAQYWSCNRYVGTTMGGDLSAFGFNFADGRIKSYPVVHGRSQRGRRPVFRRYVRCVRGPVYGENDFVDNGDGTVTDRATGLMWMKNDSGRPVNWEKALEYAENLEYAGYNDWRLPNVKELQSIVDYHHAPDARSASNRGPAIDPIFRLTDDESWFWTSTTHVENGFGYYVCFGQGFSAKKHRGRLMNAHGAGAVRSDPKSGNPSGWRNGLGPQSDQIRIYNYVRCVRGGQAVLRSGAPAFSPSYGPESDTVPHGRRPPREHRPGFGSVRPHQGGALGKPHGGLGPPRFSGSHFVQRLDTNGDGKVSRAEFDGPPHDFPRLDRNGDGFLDADEAPPPPPHGRPPPHKRPPRLR